MLIIQNEATKLNIAMGPSECYSFTTEKAKHCRDPNQHDTQNETTKPNTAETQISIIHRMKPQGQTLQRNAHLHAMQAK